MVPTNAAAAAGAAWYNFFLIQHGVPHGIEFGLWKRKRRQGRTLKHVTAVTVATKRTHSSPRGATTGEGLCDHSSVQERLPPRRRAPRRRGGRHRGHSICGAHPWPDHRFQALSSWAWRKPMVRVIVEASSRHSPSTGVHQGEASALRPESVACCEKRFPA